MGTNFYWIDDRYSDFLRDLTHSKFMPCNSGPYCGLFPSRLITIAEFLDECEQGSLQYHVGKRSAAGPYCWDCRVTLCKGGEERIHYNSEWHESCPKCNAPQIKEETFKEGAIALELGFSEHRPSRPEGVRSCSSFSWAMDPSVARDKCRIRSNRKMIRDEYGREFTGPEFLDMLQTNCPVEFTHSIGVEFC